MPWGGCRVLSLQRHGYASNFFLGVFRESCRAPTLAGWRLAKVPILICALLQDCPNSPRRWAPATLQCQTLGYEVIQSSPPTTSQGSMLMRFAISRITSAYALAFATSHGGKQPSLVLPGL